MNNCNYGESDSSSMLFHRILIINSVSINSDRAESITMRSIFNKWPKECLMELCFSADKFATDYGILSCVVPLRYSPLQVLSNKKLFRHLNIIIKGRYKISAIEENSVSRTILKRSSPLMQLRQWLALSITNSPYFLPVKLKQAIFNFQPDAIYTISGGLSITKMVNRVSVMLGVPIVPHFMDNWQESLEWNGNHLLKGYKKKLDIAVEQMYSRSFCALGISEKMAEVYEQKWHIPHYPLMNSIDVESFFCNTKTMTSSPMLVYAGGLHLGRWKAIKLIGDVIDRYNVEYYKCCNFYVYCPTTDLVQYKGNLTAKCIHLCEAVPHKNIHNIYEDADILVHGENGDIQVSDYVKYSVSTKIPEYLASNRPVLYLGPKNLYLTEFLTKHDVCFLGTDEDSLYQELKMLLTDNHKREKKLENAHRLGSAFFSIARATSLLNYVFSVNVNS